jgi:glycosyltransferase involved in cell wall biosynthesis
MSAPIRVLELRSVAGTGGGPDKTILASARRNNPDVLLTVCYLCNAGDDTFKIGEQARAMGLDYVEIRERGMVDPAAWRALRALVRDRHIDIVHGHEYKTDLLAYLLARAERVIPFATAHGWTGHSTRERRVYYPVDKRLLVRFPRVAAVSGEIKRALVSVGADPRRIDVILNSIDPVRFVRDPNQRAPARTTYGLAPGDIVIGAVGRLEPQKRFDLLIEAFAKLATSRPALRLLIAGEGSLRGALHAQIEARGLGSRCRLTGQSDVIPFHHAIDLFVQSSEYEGTPNVVLEAMALETPFVATDVGGTGELFQDGVHGLLIQPRDQAALVGAVERILSDPAAARQRALAARRVVETDLSFDRRMEKIDRVYAELMQERSVQQKPTQA